MATLDQFLPYLLPYAVGCPTALARRSLLNASIEFARRTLVLKEIEQKDVVLAQDYTLNVPAQCVITRVKDVMCNGRPLAPTSVEMIRYSPALAGADSGEAELKSGLPQSFFQRELHTPVVSLYPVPDFAMAGGLVVVYWYEPSINATTVPDILFDVYQDDIINGALEKILMVADQSFTNVAEAARRAKLFSAGIRNAGITARTGQVAVSSRVQPRRFA